MTIHIQKLHFETIIGLLDFERTTPQEVILDITLTYTYAEGVFVNYATIAEALSKHIQTQQYLLLEEALLGMKALLLQSVPQMEKLSLKITKPHILPNCHVALSEDWNF